jgi:hypothetical protein
LGTDERESDIGEEASERGSGDGIGAGGKGLQEELKEGVISYCNLYGRAL